MTTPTTTSRVSAYARLVFRQASHDTLRPWPPPGFLIYLVYVQIGLLLADLWLGHWQPTGVPLSIVCVAVTWLCWRSVQSSSTTPTTTKHVT